MIQKNILTLLFLSLSLTVFSQAELEEVSVTNLRMLNTPSEDFVAVPYGDGIMYNTNVKDNKCDTCRFQNLRFAQLKTDGDCSFGPGEVVPNSFSTKVNLGAATFSPDGKMMIISQNNAKPSKQKDRRKTMKLSTATMSAENSWVIGEDLPFNSLEFETTHPSLSADGQTLYFASNRPGGLGGMDIWKVTKEGENWGTPMNLGAPINSAANELFPSITQNDALYFSSARAGGVGALDIYEGTMNGGAWTIKSLAAPFNSRSDDLGYVENADGESGYLTSDRSGGQGKDDLYCWKVNEIPVILAVEDATNSKRLPGATLSVTDASIAAKAFSFIADGDGAAQPENIKFRKTYTINVEKEGYMPWSKEVNANELAMAPTYVVPLVPRAYNLAGDVKLLGSETVVPGAKIVLHNLTTGEKREVIAGADGTFTFDNIHCFEDYELIAYKDDRTSEKFPLPSTMIDCASDKPTKATLRLPVPPPVAPVCACNDAGMLSLPVDATPKQIHTLGSRPEFGDSHALDAAGFFNKLKKRYDVSSRDKAFLDELFTTMGYANGFADASAGLFNDTNIPNGMTGNMGYTKRHRIQYVQLNAKRDRDLAAFKVASANGCDVYFMKTCGNLFFFCNN